MLKLKEEYVKILEDLGCDFKNAEIIQIGTIYNLITPNNFRDVLEKNGYKYIDKDNDDYTYSIYRNEKHQITLTCNGYVSIGRYE